MTKTLNQLTEITTLADDDLLLARDVSAVEDKRITIANLQAGSAKLSGGADANFTAMPQMGGDPIVESGSNSDGEWTRWADGTQICALTDTDEVYGNLSSQGDGQINVSVDYPVSFISGDLISISACWVFTGSGTFARDFETPGFCRDFNETSAAAGGFTWSVFIAEGAGPNAVISYIAAGRWK